jgi:hypothetical protein
MFAFSEDELPRELHDAQTADGRDGTKGDRVATGIRIAVVRGIEQVEALRTEMRTRSLWKMNAGGPGPTIFSIFSVSSRLLQVLTNSFSSCTKARFKNMFRVSRSAKSPGR